jgi:hypothetical protein
MHWEAKMEDDQGFVLVSAGDADFDDGDDQDFTLSDPPSPGPDSDLNSNFHRRQGGDDDHPPPSPPKYLPEVDKVINSLADALWPLNTFIHSHPELAFKEYQAHDALTGFMRSQKDPSWEVTPSAYGLETAWTAVYDSGKPGPVVAFNAEMGKYLCFHVPFYWFLSPPAAQFTSAHSISYFPTSHNRNIKTLTNRK